MIQTTAQQALIEARELQRSAREQVYREQCEAFKGQAEQAYREVIRPWWQAFVQSQQGAQLGLLVRRESIFSNDEPKLYHPRISERVRYMREDGREWEAYLFLDGKPRALELHVRQLREGHEPRSWSGAMFAGFHKRQVPMEESELPDLDFHLVVLIDFAEQIMANVVAAHIQQHLLTPLS